jgi:hypothetical protein
MQPRAQPPYGVIRDLLHRGRVIPFLGAGASQTQRPKGFSGDWAPDGATFLPSGVDLARWLAGQTNLPSKVRRDRENLAKVAMYYVDVAGREHLRSTLRQAFVRADAPYGPTPLHRLLASIPVPLVIFSTNYDTLLEQAFQDAKKPYDLVVYRADDPEMANTVWWWRDGEPEPDDVVAEELDIDLSTTTVIYKMHGTVMPLNERWDTFVITEDDYVDFLYRMTSHSVIPAIFYPHFRTRSFLFLGYGLQDWNWWVVMKSLKFAHRLRPVPDGAGQFALQSDDSSPDWAIQRHPSPLEQELWRTRRVHIFDVELETFVVALRGKGG